MIIHGNGGGIVIIFKLIFIFEEGFILNYVLNLKELDLVLRTRSRHSSQDHKQLGDWFCLGNYHVMNI